MRVMQVLRTYFANVVDLQHYDYPVKDNGIVVSFTTVPSRIAMIKPTILSLLQQSVRPGQIEINLGRVPQKKDITWQIPAWLTTLQAVKIFWLEQDLGPATKFIPTLLRYQNTDTRIIVVDDDMIYARNLIEKLVTADHVAKGNAVFCVNGHPITANLHYFEHPSDRAIHSGQRQVAIIEGCGGYCIRASQFDLEALQDLKGAPEGAFRMDDIWISGHLSRRNIPKYQVPVGKRHSLPQARLPAIQGDRVELSDQLLRYFAQDWQEGEVIHNE